MDGKGRPRCVSEESSTPRSSSDVLSAPDARLAREARGFVSFRSARTAAAAMRIPGAQPP